ncbi:MAG: hypothetical protein JO363_22070 [Solirubrobacterales bacterium]|nr:hypothetical protein [Solirubrobacterales bacterium]
MRRLSMLTAALGAAALILAGGGAYALASASSGTITVCVKHGDGSLYKAGKCARHDKQLSWNKQGVPGATGPQGPQGPQGVQGPAGPFPPTLPSGKTLRGVFLSEGNAAAANANAGDNISFGWTLSAKPTQHFIKVGAPVPAGCSGTPQAPGANPGNLCVFEVENSNINDTVSEVWSPPADSANAAEAYGAAVYTRSTAAGGFEFGGSWAVTAP